MKQNLWPYCIIAYFVCFICGIVVWVSYAVRHDEQLVRSDYYVSEMTYQKQIDRIARTDSLQAEIEISYDPAGHAITIGLPLSGPQQVAGSVQLYRPSDARLDREIPLALNVNGTQRIDTAPLQDGLWKLRLSWSEHGQEYFCERSLVVAR